MSIKTTTELARICQDKSFDYDFYIQQCGARGFQPLDEREFNKLATNDEFEEGLDEPDEN